MADRLLWFLLSRPLERLDGYRLHTPGWVKQKGQPLAELTRGYFRAYVGVHLIAYGLVLLGVMLFLPQGLVPAARAWWRRGTRTRAAA